MSDDEGTNSSNAELESLKQKLIDAEEKLNTSQTLLTNAIAALGAAAGAGAGGLPAAPAPVVARKTAAEILRD